MADVPTRVCRMWKAIFYCSRISIAAVAIGSKFIPILTYENEFLYELILRMEYGLCLAAA